jgi:hypothetical protein
MQKHDIDVAKRIEFPAAISTESDQCQRYAGLAVSVSCGGGGSENVLQQNVNKLGSPAANLAAASARLVLQAQAMFFDLEKFFVKRKDLGRSSRPGRGKLIRRMRQDFFEMSGCRHFGF